jgi:beta-lactamase class A
VNRRDILCSSLALLASPALAQEAQIAALEDYERGSGGRIGLWVQNLPSGETIAWRAHERFVMCSTFKASLAACVLASADRGRIHLDELLSYGRADLLEYAPVARQNLKRGAMSVTDMCAAAVELSDNTCANVLLARVGGPSALTAFWRSIGDAISRLDHNEPDLNRSPPGDPHDSTTPAAMAGNLRSIVLGKVLSPDSRQRLTDWILGCKTGNNRLRSGLPKDWRVGDKTGNNGRDAFADIAVTWPTRAEPVLICVYTHGGAPTSSQVDTVFTGIGRLVGARFLSAAQYN